MAPIDDDAIPIAEALIRIGFTAAEASRIAALPEYKGRVVVDGRVHVHGRYRGCHRATMPPGAV